MDIYDGPYFKLNKKMMCIVGLWPYDSRKRVVGIFWIVFAFILIIPHFIGVVVDFTDIDKLMHHLFIVLLLLAIFLKHATLVIADNKMRSVYDDIENNWLLITDEEEKKILVEYSNRGRMLGIGYTGLLIFGTTTFDILPLVPEILNAINPLPVPRSRVYVLEGEFLVDNKDDYFWIIYSWDVITSCVIVLICASIDSMYMAIGEHCCALYAIVAHRLSKLGHEEPNNSPYITDSSYEWIVHTVKLHQTVLSSASNINDSYSMCFFCLTILNLIAIPTTCVIMMINWDDPVDFVRFAMGICALMLHIFVIFWPGQKLIDHSTKLQQDTYFNEWYETSERTKTILRILMIRCSRSTSITAGGLVEMNFENYFKVVKTAVSYITVIASFRSN